MNEDNVLTFEDRELDISVEPTHYGCRHRRPAARKVRHGPDWTTGEVYCRDCDDILDPFHVLVRFAQQLRKRQRAQRKHEGLEDAMAWLLEHDGRLSLTGVAIRVTAVVNGKKKVATSEPGRGGKPKSEDIVATIARLVPWNERGAEWVKL